MAGVLLTPGVVVTRKSARNISRVFLHSLSKAKFENACKRLQLANLGQFMSLNRGVTVFIKKQPEEVAEILQREENCDLCTFEEYLAKFDAPLPAPIKDTLINRLNEIGALPGQSVKRAEAEWIAKSGRHSAL